MFVSGLTELGYAGPPGIDLPGSGTTAATAESPPAMTLATASATAHALTTLLRAAPDVSAGDQHISCGHGVRAPVATHVPPLVREVCGRFRAHLPQRVWARAAWAFTDGLQRPDPNSVWAHRQCPPLSGDPAGEGHDSSRCPRCCVLVAALGALRECVAEVAQVRPMQTTSRRTLPKADPPLYMHAFMCALTVGRLSAASPPRRQW